ncbi:SBF-like CPA transporter family-domain-containing protein [Phyllosticta capitalensis]|uniref:SBF-like CPA transporter family-domain-containing protein n=1 Tax=Phyllosticta capitalensis TaxID=121624 RepID=UPI00312DB8AD
MGWDDEAIRPTKETMAASSVVVDDGASAHGISTSGACSPAAQEEKQKTGHEEERHHGIPHDKAAAQATTTTPTTTVQNASPSPHSAPPSPSHSSSHHILPRPLHKLFQLLLSQWLMFGLGLVCLLAYLFPHVAAHGGIIRSEYSILYGAVAIIFLISGLSLAPRALLVHALNWRLHVLVQGFCFVVCPVSVYIFVRIIDAGDTAGVIDRAVLVGWLLTACIPTTIASNVVMTRAAGGDEAAALVEVLLGNVFGPVVSPAWTVALIPHNARFAAWQGDAGDLTGMYRSVFRLLGLSVYLPLVVGQCVRWAWPRQTAWCVGRLYLGKVGTVCLLLLIWYVHHCGDVLLRSHWMPLTTPGRPSHRASPPRRCNPSPHKPSSWSSSSTLASTSSGRFSASSSRGSTLPSPHTPKTSSAPLASKRPSPSASAARPRRPPSASRCCTPCGRPLTRRPRPR